jgi:hypothetical protein
VQKSEGRKKNENFDGKRFKAPAGVGWVTPGRGPQSDKLRACECFLPTLFEKDKQKCSQRVLGLVCYKIYMF